MTRFRPFTMIALPVLAAQITLAGCAAPQKRDGVTPMRNAPASACRRREFAGEGSA